MDECETTRPHQVMQHLRHPNPGGLKALRSIVELSVSIECILVTQQGRGLPCIGFVDSDTFVMQYRIVVGFFKKFENLCSVKFTPSRAFVSKLKLTAVMFLRQICKIFNTQYI